MKTFNTISDVNHSVVTIPAHRDRPAKALDAPVPTGTEHNVMGDGTRKWQIKPQSEMPWSLVKELEIIKMTPYSTGNEKVSNHVASFPRQSAKVGWNEYEKYIYDYYKDQYVWDRSFGGYFVAHSTWTENISLSTINGRWPIFSVPPYDYSKELNEAKANVISKSMNGLDLLTNLAELPETLGMILGFLKAARHPIESAKEALEKYKKRQRYLNDSSDPHKRRKLAALDRDFRNQWLQYRYGIMPLILSIKDAIELLDEKILKFHTEHSGDVIDVSATSKPIFNVDIGSYVYENRVGSIKIRTTGKAKFGSAGARLSDLITVNPFLTAWELIPLSFVIDWFVNVGDVIFSNTSALVDISEQRSFCYSVKKEITTQTILYMSYDDTINLHVAENYGLKRPEFNQSFPLEHKSHQVLRTVSEETYDRVLFQPSDVDFEFNPSLGWMRQLDAYALSFSSISKLLKKLR